MARTMPNEMIIAKYFWVDAINIACYIQNKILIRLNYLIKHHMNYGKVKSLTSLTLNNLVVLVIC